MKFLTFALFALFSTMALADYNKVPYTKEAFEKSQEKNEKIMLQVYASWCPVCKNEDKVFNNVKGEEVFKKVTYYQANFDTEAQLKKDFNIKNPGTVVLFEGKKEVARTEQIPTENDFKNLVSKFSK